MFLPLENGDKFPFHVLFFRRPAQLGTPRTFSLCSSAMNTQAQAQTGSLTVIFTTCTHNLAITLLKYLCLMINRSVVVVSAKGKSAECDSYGYGATPFYCLTINYRAKIDLRICKIHFSPSPHLKQTHTQPIEIRDDFHIHIRFGLLFSACIVLYSYGLLFFRSLLHVF